MPASNWRRLTPAVRSGVSDSLLERKLEVIERRNSDMKMTRHGMKRQDTVKDHKRACQRCHDTRCEPPHVRKATNTPPRALIQAVLETAAATTARRLQHDTDTR
ncbi:hypothetical protein CLAM6_01910 [Cobetia sp. AM6]|nr:hypothetical protein CLAM6_01910 [Cobetia sp. AM6]